MLALRTGLDDLEAVGDGVVDRLIVADLEMEERHLAGRAPTRAVSRSFPMKLMASGNRLIAFGGKDQQHAIGHVFAEQREELAVEIGLAPFAGAGVFSKNRRRRP